jgi:tetratricopeptide (TPR) repeat protein
VRIGDRGRANGYLEKPFDHDELVAVRARRVCCTARVCRERPRLVVGDRALDYAIDECRRAERDSPTAERGQATVGETRRRRSAGGQMPHAAFLEALQHGEGTRDWLATRAGLVLVRFVSAWSESEWGLAQLAEEATATAEAIAALAPDDGERATLTAVLAAMRSEVDRARVPKARRGPEAVALVADELLAYAHALKARSAWAIAAEVYGQVWEACAIARPLTPPPDAPPDLAEQQGETAGGRRAEDTSYPPAAPLAALHLAICQRMLGRATESAKSYATARASAKQCRDGKVGEYVELRARLGEALLTLDRGNLPAAERQIAAVLVDSASGAHLADVQARAWHDRAVVAFRRGRVDDAIAWAYRAWRLTTDALQREQILLDLATFLLAAGFRGVSRSANRLAYHTARGPWTRWSAAVNLIELATLDRQDAEFRRWVEQMRGVAMPPTLEGEYHYYVALGWRAFGDPARAGAALDRATAVAERHRLGELLVRADGLRDTWGAGRESERSRVGAPAAVPYGVAKEVADAIDGERALAGVANEEGEPDGHSGGAGHVA